LKSIGIASGKGGVGKTTIATNLASTLAKANYRVMLVDGDFGLANVQLTLGLYAKYNIGHYLRGEKTIKEIMLTTGDGLMVIPGASGVGGLANLKPEELSEFVQGLVNPIDPVDYLIFDAAAGISDNVIQLLKACDESLIVVRDDPSSIADGYGIIKVLVKEHDYQSIGIIASNVDSENAAKSLVTKINNACTKFLGIELPFVGHVEEDSAVKDAAKQYKPVIEIFPTSKASVNFRGLAKAVAER
jgi:flagellar biosynthesis protein FlhG